MSQTPQKIAKKTKTTIYKGGRTWLFGFELPDFVIQEYEAVEPQYTPDKWEPVNADD